jgi:hypothetical protein
MRDENVLLASYIGTKYCNWGLTPTKINSLTGRNQKVNTRLYKQQQYNTEGKHNDIVLYTTNTFKQRTQ